MYILHLALKSVSATLSDNSKRALWLLLGLTGQSALSFMISRCILWYVMFNGATGRKSGQARNCCDARSPETGLAMAQQLPPPLNEECNGKLDVFVDSYAALPTVL